jgi:modulator of FtsH protease
VFIPIYPFHHLELEQYMRDDKFSNFDDGPVVRRHSGTAHAATMDMPYASSISINKVVKNTYLLLGMTLLMSTATAGYAVMSNAAPMNWILTLVGTFGLLFGVMYTRNSPIALPMVFAFTGFVGYSIGPTISMYLNLPNGAEIVTTSLGLTALIFLSLSAYALTTKKDFSFLGGFLFVGLIVGIVASIIGMFVDIPGLQLAVAAAFVLIFSGYILFDTSRIINGGETNYVMATVSLYLDILNLFLSLLQLVAAFTGRD